jgi:transposase InsO family protein
MSRKGNCWDNAPMESFYATLKGELVEHHDYLGLVDKPDSQAALGVIEDCLLGGGGFGALSDERCGMGSIRAVPDWVPLAGRPSSARSSAHVGRDILDRPHRGGVA